MEKKIVTTQIAFDIMRRAIVKCDNYEFRKAVHMFKHDIEQNLSLYFQLIYDAILANNDHAVDIIGRHEGFNGDNLCVGTGNGPLFIAIDTKNVEMIRNVLYLNKLDLHQLNKANISALTYAFSTQNKVGATTLERYTLPKDFEIMLQNTLIELDITKCKSFNCLMTYFFGDEEHPAQSHLQENLDANDLSVIQQYKEIAESHGITLDQLPGYMLNDDNNSEDKLMKLVEQISGEKPLIYSNAVN